MLPVLFGGLAQSSTQAKSATATRFLYSVVEQGRENAENVADPSSWCASVATLVTSNVPPGISAAVTECTADSDSLVTLTLTATSSTSPTVQLATASAKVYVP